MNPRTRRIALVVGAVAILGVVAWLALFRSPGFVPPPLPDPNGYDDFIEARSLFASPAWDWEEVESTALKEMVAGQAQALSVMRQGFLKECRVPMIDSEQWGPGLGGVKSLALALCAEARLAQEEERIADATQSCIDMFQLADAATSGGVLIHALVRGAADGIAESQVRVIMPELSSDEARQIASQLEQILSDREPFIVMQKREEEWEWEDPSMTLTWWLKNAIAAKSLQPFKQPKLRAQQKCMQWEHLVLRLLLDLASRAYELEQGHPPESADQLVPDYLKAVPMDPVTGDPMAL